MKITILTENFAGAGFLAEHGLSYLIEIENEKILFDTGYTDVYLKNARTLNIDLQEVKKIILSHGHWDHGDGIRYLNNRKIIAHPGIFIKRYRKNDHSEVGLSFSKDELEKKHNLVTSREPFEISKNIIFLGEIPRKNDFEGKYSTFIDENGSDDFVLDDSGIAINLGNSLAIITGCSHSGICNIIEHAKSVTGIKTIKTIIGGFHLKENNHQTRSTINYLKSLKPEQVYPSHCTELPALIELHNAFEIQQLKTGMILEI